MNMKTAFIIGGLFFLSLSCFGFTGQTRKVYDGPAGNSSRGCAWKSP